MSSAKRGGDWYDVARLALAPPSAREPVVDVLLAPRLGAASRPVARASAHTPVLARAVAVGAMKLARCRSCDAPIVWTRTERGKNMPVDADPTVAPRGFRLEEHGDDVLAKFVAKPDQGERVHVAHWSTCPYADAHRL